MIKQIIPFLSLVIILNAQSNFSPQTKADLQTAVNLWVSDETSAIATYGEINTWDVSLITDMQALFKNASSFNGDISSWDVSSVTNMQEMFRDAINFNGDLSSWNVSNVTNMEGMFVGAVAFNQDLGDWDVSSVTNMASMFRNASSFNGDISSWNVSNVLYMGSMFNYASSLSEENQCAIHTSFSSNSAWSYDWSGFCAEPLVNNYSLSFDGVDDYVDLINMPSDLNSFSYMGWYKQYATTGIGQPIINTPNGKVMFSASGESIYASAYQNRNGTSPAFQLGTVDHGGTNNWNQFAFIVNGDNQLLYINGLLLDSELEQYNFNDVYALSQIGSEGRSNANNDSYFNGMLDEFSVWDLPLTEQQIQAYINTPLSGDELGLIAYWDFNEGEGTVLTDQSGNGNNGIIEGATWSDDVPSIEEEDRDWKIQISASQQELEDADNYLGVSVNATDGFDNDFDQIEPPANPGDELRVYFPHPDWSHPLGTNFSADIRSEMVSPSVEVWEMEIVSTNAGDVFLDFSFHQVPDLPVMIENVETEEEQLLVDNSNYVFTAVAEEVYSFKITIGDITPPELVLLSSPNGPGVYFTREVEMIEWSIDGLEESTYATIHESIDNGENFTQIAIVENQNSYAYVLPDLEEGLQHGLMIAVEAEDDNGNVSFTSNKNAFTLVGAHISTNVPAGWNLWSSPLDPTESSLLEDNLDDDFGDSYYVGYNWQSNGYQYAHYLYHNQGYWLGTTQAADVDIVGTISQTNVTKELAEGWELISNPLVLDISVDSLMFDNGVEDPIFYSEAVELGWVNVVYGYEESAYELVTTLEPWKAYWLSVLEEDINVLFPFHNKPVEENSDQRENAWYINFQASIEGATDKLLTIGSHEDASDLFDVAFDKFSPPVPPTPNQISLTIAHPEWNNTFEDEYKKDIRSLLTEGAMKQWNVDVHSSSETVTLTWDFQMVPSGYEVSYSIDNGQTFSDMRDTEAILLASDMELIVRVETQLLGIDTPDVPSVFSLYQNYPNPFNPTTQIKYDLPSDGLVNVSIYDITGRYIKSLINNNQSAGYHSVRWDATNNIGEAVSAGMYIYTIQAGEYRATKKMVLLK